MILSYKEIILLMVLISLNLIVVYFYGFYSGTSHAFGEMLKRLDDAEGKRK